MKVTAETVNSRNVRTNMARLLNPDTIALVGLSDSSPLLEFIEPTLKSDAEVFFVNPKYDTVLGYKCYPSLSSIGKPIDAVMSVMAAERTTELVEEAAELGIGGIVSIAGGFKETSAEGEALQERLVRAADSAGIALVGPNGLGYINVPRSISLTVAGQHKRRPGGISIVSQSGAILSGISMASWDYPGVGLNVMVSAGNEAVSDLADFVDYLVDDPTTTAIGLVVETIRRPAEFFEAARRAVTAGKPIVVLKLARSSKSQEMAKSHTGALTGDAWVYDVAMRQAGIAIASDPEELVDRLAMFEQLDPSRWSKVESLGVIAMSGGYASLSVDIAESLGMTLPALGSLESWVQETFPGIMVPNPLDTTGLGGKFWPDVVERFSQCEESDALLYVHPLAQEDERASTIGFVDKFISAAKDIDQPFVIANCSGHPGDFVLDRLPKGKVAAGRGLRSTLRGLQTLGEFVRFRETAQHRESVVVSEVPKPQSPTVQIAEGAMLTFAASMELLAAAGIPVADYHLISADAQASDVRVPFEGPYVVKLADVGHRTEYGAVRLKIWHDTLADTITELRDIAAQHNFSPVVVVQPMVEILGEAFVGIQADSELGPLVVFGLGGIFVEVLQRVGGRMAPLSKSEADSLIAEFEDVKVMHGFRGSAPWDLDSLAEILQAVGRLAAGAGDWLGSLDMNPLVYTPTGFVAVDALILVREDAR